eukprot:362607-Chlamydomonas_euryale.AAC.16
MPARLAGRTRVVIEDDIRLSSCHDGARPRPHLLASLHDNTVTSDHKLATASTRDPRSLPLPQSTSCASCSASSVSCSSSQVRGMRGRREGRGGQGMGRGEETKAEDKPKLRRPRGGDMKTERIGERGGGAWGRVERGWRRGDEERRGEREA